MVMSFTETFLGVLLFAITVCFSEGASTNIGAPDSNNLSMEFTPDDAVAGGTDTSLDNSNATPLFFTTPALTTALPSTPTTTLSIFNPVIPTLGPNPGSGTTGNLVPIGPTTPSSITITTILTSRPVLTTARSGVDKPNMGPTTWPNINWFTENPNNPYPNFGSRPPLIDWPHYQHNGHHHHHHQHNGHHPHGQRPGGRFNLPWWMLLLEEA